MTMLIVIRCNDNDTDKYVDIKERIYLVYGSVSVVSEVLYIGHDGQG